MNGLRYRDAGSYFKCLGIRLQKLSIDAGFTCPNIDGSKARGGCTYCLNHSFKPSYCRPKKTIKEQLDEGMLFFAHKSNKQNYIAYFQSYTNTYASIDILRYNYEEALKQPYIKGLAISTRPDCINNETLEYLGQLAKEHIIIIELGVESCNDKALEFVNRQHSFQETEDAIIRISKYPNIHIGAHLIMGLPYDDTEQCKNNALQLTELPIDIIKLHQLQILKGTVMEKQYREKANIFNLFDEMSYLDLCVDIIENINTEVCIERFVSQVPPNLLVAPRWNKVKNFEFAHKINNKLKSRNTYQGVFYKP